MGARSARRPWTQLDMVAQECWVMEAPSPKLVQLLGASGDPGFEIREGLRCCIDLGFVGGTYSA